jgi:hypothetical protein
VTRYASHPATRFLNGLLSKWAASVVFKFEQIFSGWHATSGLPSIGSEPYDAKRTEGLFAHVRRLDG